MKLIKLNLSKWLILPSFIVMFLLTSQASLASLLFYLTPMMGNLSPAGKNASKAFQVVNASQDKSVAVELYLAKREVGIDGKETYAIAKAEEDFLLYPPQTFLQPGEAQTVRVSWVGNPDPSYELAYRLIVEQVPLETNPQPSNVNNRQINITTLVRYGGSIYITPKDAVPNVVLESAVHQKGEGGSDQLVLTLNNKGTAHTLLQNLTLTIVSQEQPGKSVQLAPADLPGLSGENILAHHQRRFIIPWPPELPVGGVDVTFEHQGRL